MPECLTIFSCKMMPEVRDLGGVGWFKLSISHVEKCRYVVVYHNSNDPRKPGNPDSHRLPILIAEINGTHRDPKDNRVAVRVSRAAFIKQNYNRSPVNRSPVRYVDDGLISQLRLEAWEKISPKTLEQALAVRSELLGTMPTEIQRF